MKKRTRLTKIERMAALMLEIRRGDKAVVTREEAEKLTPQEIVDLFTRRTQDDHIVPVGLAGNDPEAIARVNHVSNRRLIPTEEHGEKTKGDVKAIAKAKRIERDQAEFRRRMLAKAGGGVPDCPDRSRPKQKIKSRPMAGTRASGLRKRMDGRVEKW